MDGIAVSRLPITIGHLSQLGMIASAWDKIVYKNIRIDVNQYDICLVDAE